ncbi:MAG: sigma-70 family RNA polymerase sigma factor [Deltaproteobacteria bacterium]|nr:sigma-70 family RNA polymerase sigma factor [Nannocystaceae bacterium]
MRAAEESPAEGTDDEVDALVGEIEAVRAVQAGDFAAFAALYSAYWPTVHGIVLARARAVEIADIVQDVFVVALQRIGELRDPAAFGGWMAAIARHASVDAVRRHRPTTEVTDDARIGMPPPRLEALAVLRAIRELPEAYRETLVLRLVEGMNGPEIALRTGMTSGSVRVNLHRGMKLLRARLGEDSEVGNA